MKAMRDERDSPPQKAETQRACQKPVTDIFSSCPLPSRDRQSVSPRKSLFFFNIFRLDKTATLKFWPVCVRGGGEGTKCAARLKTSLGLKPQSEVPGNV